MQVASDPALLAAVAGAALEWDWQVGLDMARRAVAIVARYPNGSFLRRGARTIVNQAEGRIIAYSLGQK